MTSRRPILVIEDSDDDFEILSLCFQAIDPGLELRRCATAQEIEQYLETADGDSEWLPSVALLDLNLPGADGRDVLSQFRKHRRMQAVPVIILSTSSRPSDIETCYRIGASGYMVKPGDLYRFESMVRRFRDYWFECMEPRAAAAAGAGPVWTC